MKKRAQVTLFIVVGLVILALVFGFLVLREKSITTEVGVPEISDVPAELRPVHNFINDIIYETAVEGLEILGLQGGWISIDDASLSGQSFFVHPDETNSEVLTLHHMNVPYWYFMSSPNDCISNCEFSTKGRPVLRSQTENPANRPPDDNSVESQLDRYLEKNLKSRLDFGFAALKRQGYDVTGEGNIGAITIIGEGDLSVSISYKVTIEGGEGEGKLDQFFVRIPLNLQEFYDLASEIIEAEVSYNFLDNLFLNWITLFQGITNELPPPSGMEIGGTPATWIFSNVKNFIQYDLFVPFIPAIQLQDTKNYKANTIEGDEDSNLYRIRSGIMTSLEPKFLTKPYDLSVNFFYHPDWDIYLNVEPRDGQIIRSDNLENNFLNMLSFSLQTYSFFYDVSVPILIIMRDDDALNGEGYNFQFAIESNIRSNVPLSPDAVMAALETPEGTLFDDQSQWISKQITIEVIDNFGEPLEDVYVKYTCGTESVNIGQTKIDEEGKALLISRFPLCQNGLLRLSRQGYLGYDAIRLDPTLQEGAYILVQV